MKRWLGVVAVLGVIATTAYAQTSVGQETREGKMSPEGGAYGAGPDVHELESHDRIINWWSWKYEGSPFGNIPAHKGWPAPFGFAIINFGVFLALLGKLSWGPLKQFMQERHDRIGNNLKESARLRAEAEAMLKQYEDKLRGIDREVDTLLAQVRKEAENEKARLMAAAEADAKRLKADAERQIAAEIDRARRELRRGVIEAAVTAAQQSLQKNIAPDDQRKMAEHYVAEVERTAKAGRPS